MAKTTICGVTAHIWGTRYGSLYWQDIKKIFFGGGKAHSALTITIPANNHGLELITRYCLDDKENIILPYKEKTVQFSNGETEKVYEITFSWWPLEGSPYFLESNLNNDRIMQLVGADFPWGRDAQEHFKPEKRMARGGLVSGIKTIGPQIIQHSRNIDAQTEENITKYADTFTQVRMKKESLDSLKNKLEQAINKNKAIWLTTSNRLLISNLFKELGQKYLQDKKIGIHEAKEFLEIVNTEISKIGDISLYEEYYDHYLTVGMSEQLIDFPIKTFPGTEIGVLNGLDVEKMLAKMHELARSSQFELHGNNCAETTSVILEAGVQQPYLKHILRQRTIINTHSPAIFFNSLLKVKHEIYRNEEPNLWQRIRLFNLLLPLEIAIGGIVKFASNAQSLSKILLAVSALPFFVVLAVVALTLKAIAWPFIKIGDALFAPSDKKVVAVSQEAGYKTQTETEIGYFLNTKKIIEIHNENINDAIYEFANILVENKCIPVFSEKTKAKIVRLIKKDPSTPFQLIESLQKLHLLELPKDFDYSSLLNVVDNLQIISLEHAKKIFREQADLRKSNPDMVYVYTQEGVTIPKEQSPEHSKPKGKPGPENK